MAKMTRYDVRIRKYLLQENNICLLLFKNLANSLGPFLQVGLVQPVNVPGHEHQALRGLSGQETLLQGCKTKKELKGMYVEMMPKTFSNSFLGKVNICVHSFCLVFFTFGGKESVQGSR